MKRRSYLGENDQEAEWVSCLLRTSCCNSPSECVQRHEASDFTLNRWIVCLQRLRGWLGHAHASVSPVEARWATSTPAKREAEPNFDHEIIGAWLGVKSPAPTDGKTSCSRMVQTEVSHIAGVPAEPADEHLRLFQALHAEEDSCCEEEQMIRSRLRSGAEIRRFC